MIIDLTIENFKSIRDPVQIRFATGTTKRLPGNLLQLPNGERFVKSMALYGPNASGKTTVLDALYSLQAFVRFSSQDQMPTARIQFLEPFLLDPDSSRKATRIALTIQLGAERYTLDVSATSQRVWSETLMVRHLGRQPGRKTQPKLLLERVWDPNRKKYAITLDAALGPALTLTAAEEQTTHNRLMLGKLAALNNPTAHRVIRWFDEDLDFYDMHRNPESEEDVLTESGSLLKGDPAFAKTIARLMQDADTGVEGLRVVDEKTLGPVVAEDGQKIEFKETIKPSLSFQHTTQDGHEVFFRRHRESSGTLRFVALLVAILQPCSRRRLICIDELSASMHPDLVCRLLQIVHSKSCNSAGHQLIFTTHDTHLLDPRRLLRRDQVTICTKDRFGRTTINRLDEFEDRARSDANLQKQYLQGRFGGLPKFGPMLEDVSQDDEPIEVGLE